MAEDKDLAAVEQIENIGNDRLRLQAGKSDLLRAADTLPKGRGAVTIAAQFAYLGKSRFSDGTFPVYYAGHTLKTAIRETVYHTERRMAASNEKPMSLLQRVLVSRVSGHFHDLRRKKRQWKAVYDTVDYTASQQLARQLWHRGSGGIVYDSVRHASGQCVAIFSPQFISHCRQERCLRYEWDGRRISHVYEIREFPQ